MIELRRCLKQGKTMKPTLRFEKMTFRGSHLGPAATVPPLLPEHVIQNQLQFQLSEYEEIFEGYGTLATSYPYRQRDGYNRELTTVEYEVAILENDFLRATFIIDLGGRLWSLVDKRRNRNLLYTNDVIRFSNLSSRNAWFSGGVEWNIGIIGHSPFTCERIFAARFERGDGLPVLRLYEYERIRGVQFQIDCFLEEDDTFLNCRMKIVNRGGEVLPMYWWSNIAVPEFAGGRLIVPARAAYFSDMRKVEKVPSPTVNGVDISFYQSIADQSDFFFELEPGKPRYIAAFDPHGEGLLQLSTNRLQARKLFSWGRKPGADRWQQFLTENAGRYLEIQAGLAKTQYGCLPMPPNTVWEWLEQYGPVQLPESLLAGSYDEAEDRLTGMVRARCAEQHLEEKLIATRSLAATPAPAAVTGSVYGALDAALAERLHRRNPTCYLDFGPVSGAAATWLAFFDTGVLACPPPEDPPEDFNCDPELQRRLTASLNGANRRNWYAHYQSGLFTFRAREWAVAAAHFTASLDCCENPWARHGLAAVELEQGDPSAAATDIIKGLAMRRNDLSYAREAMLLLLRCGNRLAVVAEYRKLPETLRRDKHLTFDFACALAGEGEYQAAWDLLTADGGLVMDDTREGRNPVADLYREVGAKLFPVCPPVPAAIDFNALSD